MGKKTFCVHQGESTIGYVICDRNVLKYVNDFEIDDFNIFSDHAVLKVRLSINRINNESKSKDHQGKMVNSPPLASGFW